MIMEEKEKYYTPEIEEFHVGFEFEVIDISEGDCERIDSINRSSGFAAFGDCFSDVRNYRVKYLDREDIESLGWITEKTILSSREETYYIFGEKHATLHVHGDGYITIDNDDRDMYSAYFDGTVKNKSELKRVMQMIGIE